MAGALALQPFGNSQGGYYFFSLSTGRVLHRIRWTVLPMPLKIVERVHALAQHSEHIHGLEFENRHGTVSDDDEDTGDGSLSASMDSLGLPNGAGVDEHLEPNDPTIENPSDDISYNNPSLLVPLGVSSSHHDISPASPPITVDAAPVPGVDRGPPTIPGVYHVLSASATPHATPSVPSVTPHATPSVNPTNMNPSDTQVMHLPTTEPPYVPTLLAVSVVKCDYVRLMN